MLNVINHEGQFKYAFSGQEVQFNGGKVYVDASAIIVYGRQDGELQWDFDELYLIYVSDEDGEPVKLTTQEEKELVTALSDQKACDPDIEERAYNNHQEDLYWSKR